MPVSNPSKTVSPNQFGCSGVATVDLQFFAAPGLLREPAEIVLVLDRSSSMTEERMGPMKAGAKRLVELVSRASGSTGHTFQGGTRMGLVSYANRAVVDAPLVDTVPGLLTLIDSYTGSGNTAHASAFETAMSLFDPCSRKRQVIILFTDGETNAGEPPEPAARKAREAGIELYCLGLITPEKPLREWASAPKDRHVYWTADINQLEALFVTLGADAVRAGALDAAINETVNPDFEIVRVSNPTAGEVRQISPQTLCWDIGTVGLTGTAGGEVVKLSFDIRHIGMTDGIKTVNESVTYRDRDGAELEFPNPTVTVACGGGEVIVPEDCPTPIEFVMDSCQDSAVIDLQDTYFASLGRIIQMSTTLKSVCPDKRVALAVMLTEVGPEGEEYSRGLKTLTIPAHSGTRCQDVKVRCIRFVVPEDLSPNPGGGDGGTLCGARNFRARVMANYIDSDFICCDSETTVS